ncbi:iron chelate uptake ABC transporter family permease subunit [Cardiobacteriaceae bacterium TAE3-ERU3]|nr:iron chelate uptake ABC transporter family permease subunit [Cardiobacteriaceae bacterium TAE3-ERU3]
MTIFIRHRIITALTLLLVLMFASIFVGTSDISIGKTWQTIYAYFHTGTQDFILWQHRIPRIILAAVAGAALGLSGALVQGIIRNPLASPDLMGISAGAGLCATALIIFLPAASLWLLAAASAIGGILAFTIILALAAWAKPTPARLALVGIAVSAFLSSCTNFLLVMYPLDINVAMLWLTGSLWGRGWQHIPLLLSTFIILFFIAYYLAWRLDVLGLGDDVAAHLGIRVTPLRLTALLIAVIIASLAVSVVGTISFIGLLAPHMARLLCGHKHRLILPLAALIGALVLLVADTTARTLFAPIELPAGVLTAVIGGPYFIYLLSRYRGWT